MIDLLPMPDDFQVPHNFTFPAGYRRRFLLHIADHKLTEIKIENGILLLRDYSLCHSPQASSWGMDWMQQVIEEVREELET